MNSTSDDNALRMKVNEAMGVYNDYMRSRGDEAADAPTGIENEPSKADGEEKV